MRPSAVSIDCVDANERKIVRKSIKGHSMYALARVFSVKAYVGRSVGRRIGFCDSLWRVVKLLSVKNVMNNENAMHQLFDACEIFDQRTPRIVVCRRRRRRR